SSVDARAPNNSTRAAPPTTTISPRSPERARSLASASSASRMAEAESDILVSLPSARVRPSRSPERPRLARSFPRPAFECPVERARFGVAEEVCDLGDGELAIGEVAQREFLAHFVEQRFEGFVFVGELSLQAPLGHFQPRGDFGQARRAL